MTAEEMLCSDTTNCDFLSKTNTSVTSPAKFNIKMINEKERKHNKV